MPLTYTTTEAIARVLRGRLTVDTVFTPGSIDVDTGLINQKGGQVEARINSRLSSVYRLPLALSDPTTTALLASLTEKLICCELLPVYYPDMSDITTGTGTGQFDRYAANLCKAGANELDLILSGIILLEGEELAAGEDAVLSRRVTVAGQRSEIVGRQDATQLRW